MPDEPVDLSARRATDGYVVESTREAFRGPIFTVESDRVRFPDGTVSGRDSVRHTGAVGVVALDDAGSVVLIQQYRHAAGEFLWELPAGILDKPGEDPLVAAQRELAEEVGLGADRWHTLVDVLTAPGFSDELVRVYLAEGLHPVATDFVRTGEEADLVVRRVPLAEALAAVSAGSIVNCVAVAGLLAAERARTDPDALRPASAPFGVSGGDAPR